MKKKILSFGSHNGGFKKKQRTQRLKGKGKYLLHNKCSTYVVVDIIQYAFKKRKTTLLFIDVRIKQSGGQKSLHINLPFRYDINRKQSTLSFLMFRLNILNANKLYVDTYSNIIFVVATFLFFYHYTFNMFENHKLPDPTFCYFFSKYIKCKLLYVYRFYLLSFYIQKAHLTSSY